MSKDVAPYQCAFSLNHEILSSACAISFEAGRLSCFPTAKVDVAALAKDLRIGLEAEGISMSASQFRALCSAEESGIKVADDLLAILLKLASTDPYEGDLVAAYEKAMFQEGVPNRLSRKVDGFPYSLPIHTRIEPMMKGIFSYAKANKEHISPLALAPFIAFEILAIQPYSAHVSLLAGLIMKSFYVSFSKELINVPVFALMEANKEMLERSYEDSVSKADTAPYVLAQLTLLEKAICSRIRHNVKTSSRSTPLLDKLLSKMEDGKFYSATELLALLGLSSRLGLQKNYLRPGLEGKKLVMSNPLVPTDRNQRYRKA